MQIIQNITMDEERALYGRQNLTVLQCAFDGPADGESALKECRNITVRGCYCNLRYPFWHNTTLTIDDCELTSLCRAACWYSQQVSIEHSKLYGIKAVRECRAVSVNDCDIVSPEFGWYTNGVTMTDTTVQSEYFMMHAADLNFSDVRLAGKYSFQYVKNAVLTDCVLDTKDAFWHCDNVVVKNSIVRGEYLGWYSKNLTFDHCKIVGTQPLCYCQGLKLIDCEMIHTDLCFERSEVEATVTTVIDSIKNPTAGRIIAPGVGQTIRDDARAKGEIVICP